MRHKPLLIKIQRDLELRCQYYNSICPEKHCHGYGIVYENHHSHGMVEYVCRSYMQGLYEKQKLR